MRPRQSLARIAALALLILASAFISRRVHAGGDVPTIIGVNEPHDTVVSPLNPHKVAVSAANALWLSNDEGRTNFAFINFPFPNGPAPLSYGTCGDSSLAFDLQGRLFWTILGCGTDAGNNKDVGIFVARINFDLGTIDAGFPVCAACGNDNNRDKQWIIVDASPSSPFKGNVYIAWSDIGSANQIKFMRSTDGGSTWSASANLSNVKGECANDARFPDDAVDAAGNLYIAWHAYCNNVNGTNADGTSGVINIVRSPNAGADILAGTFNTPVQAFLPGQAEVTWNLQTFACTVPGSKSLWAGALQPFVLPDPNRPGNVYVIADDNPGNNYCSGDQSDVVFARSTDFGASWTRSTISHGPVGTFQVFGTGAIDQLGNMYATWYDSREGNKNAGGDFLLDRYATVSRDGGLTWSNDFRINDTHFDPDAGAGCFGNPCGVPNTLRIGEYNGAAAANGYGYVSFTGNTVGGNPPAPNGQQILLDVFSILGQFPDAYEPNDSRDPGVATDLGSPDSFTLSGTINTPLDEDFFRVVAHNTGKLAFTMQSDSRASDLDIQMQDAAGKAVATATAGLDSNDTESITIPAVAGQVYFLRVFAEPNQPPPSENTYSLAIVNTPAPVPFGITLAPGSDSGRDAHDNVTNVNKPTVQLQVTTTTALNGIAFSPTNDANLADDAPGYKVGVFADGALAGFAAPAGGNLFSFTFPSALADGLRSITARVFIVDPASPPAGPHAVGSGGESGALQVTIDTAAPAAAPAPDLIASSDTGGVNDDNITTITTPQFAGTGETNALVRLYANGAQVGSDLVTAGGTYQVTSVALNDGVYNVTVQLEDLAGNVSAPSAALKVTIANRSLTLPGGTASAAGGPVTVDLAAGTIAGFGGVAGVSGKIGIVGIPVVNIDANGKALTILGTPGDDQLTYTPTGANAGTVLVGASVQFFSLTGVGGTFTIDPLTGNNDVVTVMGSAGADTVTGNVDTVSTVQVNALLTVSIPTADVDQLAISTLDGADSITLNVADTVSANLSVDAGDPAPAPNKAGDLLTVNASSPQGKVANAPGGPTQGSGVVTVSYPKTTNATTKIAYTGVEKFSK
ncbi:MAG TPA: Ig-like domain-containing protein [Dehalococcoidia bacterium]|nr:Ig-like domain-containing protein [Dehalococcoidia bacterium]